MKKLLAIFDKDLLYASRLMEYFKKTDWEDFDILLFTKPNKLCDFLKYQSVDILLYGEDNFFPELSKENIKYIFWLCTDKKSIKDKQEAINKYQAAEKIFSELLSAYTRLENNAQNNPTGNTDFISIYPPVPSAEKIAYAWSMAKELSYKKKVLFIAFELLPTALILGQESIKQSMSELLYYLKESKSDYMDKFKSYLSYSEKLSYLMGPVHGFDLLSISKEDISIFMDDIKNNSDYDTVVFYLGIYTEASMELLSRSNEIYIVTRDLPSEELVIKEWERQMELIDVSVEKLRINRVKLPKDQAII